MSVLTEGAQPVRVMMVKNSTLGGTVLLTAAAPKDGGVNINMVDLIIADY